jgi:hypothetical protein
MAGHDIGGTQVLDLPGDGLGAKPDRQIDPGDTAAPEQAQVARQKRLAIEGEQNLGRQVRVSQAAPHTGGKDRGSHLTGAALPVRNLANFEPRDKVESPSAAEQDAASAVSAHWSMVPGELLLEKLGAAPRLVPPKLGH